MSKSHRRKEIIRACKRKLEEAGLTGEFLPCRNGHTKLRVTVNGNKHQIVFSSTADPRGQRNIMSDIERAINGGSNDNLR